MVCRTYEEMRTLLERLGQVRFMGTIRRHSTRAEAEQRIYDNHLTPVRKFMHVEESVASGKSLTPRQRAIQVLGGRVGHGGGGAAMVVEEQQPQQEQEIPSSLELRTDMAVWPRFTMSLFGPGNVPYAKTDTLLCRVEWRTLKTPRSRICATLIEALETDLGAQATQLRVGSIDAYNTITKYVHGWRRNAGRNARNQEVPEFEVIDRLRTLIDSRTLSVFLSSDAIRSVRVSDSGPPGSPHPGTPSGSALSSRSGPLEAESPLPPGSGGSAPTRKRSKARTRVEIAPRDS